MGTESEMIAAIERSFVPFPEAAGGEAAPRLQLWDMWAKCDEVDEAQAAVGDIPAVALSLESRKVCRASFI